MLANGTALSDTVTDQKLESRPDIITNAPGRTPKQLALTGKRSCAGPVGVMGSHGAKQQPGKSIQNHCSTKMGRVFLKRSSLH